jgi:putative Holliday junction resolvase
LRILGVDWGSKRIGLAIAESEHGIVSPRSNLVPTGTLKLDAQNILDAAKREEAGLVVVGLPIEPDGQEGKMARLVRQLAGNIEGVLPVAFVDETLTSVEAISAMAEAGLKASERRKKVDAEAACRILERYLEQA